MKILVRVIVILFLTGLTILLPITALSAINEESSKQLLGRGV